MCEKLIISDSPAPLDLRSGQRERERGEKTSLLQKEGAAAVELDDILYNKHVFNKQMPWYFHTPRYVDSTSRIDM